MYKYEPYIRESLLTTGNVSLEQVGDFKIVNEELQENKIIQQKIIFTYNKKANTSPALLDLIAQKENKNRQIISIDFESYLNEIRQLLNTGKEAPLDGLGYIFLTKNIGYDFVQLKPQDNKIDNARRQIHHQDIEKFKKAASGKKKGNMSVALLSGALIILFIAAAGWGVYNLFFNKPDNNIVTSVNVPLENNDTISKKINAPPDTVAKQNPLPDSVSVKRDTAVYKFIFENTTDKNRAYLRVEKLRSYGDEALIDSLQTDSGFVYRLYISKRIANADTALVKDSIQKYFQRNIVLMPDDRR